MPTPEITKTMTFIILRGSIAVSLLLTILLVLYGIFSGKILVYRIACAFIIILYLFIAECIARKKHYVLAGWMILLFYTVISTSTLLVWGLNASVGILTIGLVVFLSGVILGTKYIPWVVLIIVMLLLLVHVVHNLGLIKPELESLSKPSHYADVLTYGTILSVFALISWLSSRQTEDSLRRAKIAEEKLRIEKDTLADKFIEQSRRLHQTQLQEMANLYRFAAIGQSTTATLHELSNLLSVLTLDIDDIGQQHKHSKAITNAKSGIAHINHLVRQTRQQLYDSRNVEVFNAIPIIQQTLKELSPKFNSKGIKLQKQFIQRKSFQILGDTRNLSHVITILLNNAIDACVLVKDPKITVQLLQKRTMLKISVIDNGNGIPEDRHVSLFNPHQSSKPSGLGIGLYITRNIIENQLHGKISILPSDTGAHFSIEIPRYIKTELHD